LQVVSSSLLQSEHVLESLHFKQLFKHSNQIKLFIDFLKIVYFYKPLNLHNN